MGKQTSAPPALNGQQLAADQAKANGQTAVAQQYMNQTDQVTPYGKLTYRKVDAMNMPGYEVPRYEAVTTLSPEQQQIFDSQQRVGIGTSKLAETYVDRIGQATKDPFSYDGMPAAPAYDEAARVAARDRITARQDPIFARDEEAVRTRLANQGIAPGSEAFTQAMADFGRNKNDYYLGADARAGDEATRIFGLQGDMRTRAIQEEIQRRAQPINEVAAIMGTGPGVQNPTFVNTPQTQMTPTDVVGPQVAQYQGQMQNYQIGQSANNALMGSLFGMAGTALGGWGMGGFKGLGGGKGVG